MQRMGHPLKEDTADKDSCESEVMTLEKKVPLIEDKTWGLEEVLKLEQKSGAEEKHLLNVEQVLMELGAREQPQNHGGIGQSHMKKAEPETATVETTGPGKILFEAGDLAWRETTHHLKIDEGSNIRQRGVVHGARGSHNNGVSRTKRYHDRKARRKSLKVGDQVLVLLPTDGNKVLMQWKGPYCIEAVVGTGGYKISMDGRLKVFHANLLKKYVVREVPASRGTPSSSAPVAVTCAAETGRRQCNPWNNMGAHHVSRVIKG